MISKLKYTGLVVIFLVGISATVVNDNDKFFAIAKNIEIFTNVYKELNTHYVDEIDPNSLMRIGIDAMVGSLDPYTNYYSESQLESYRISTEGAYNGIGAISKEIEKDITITNIIEGGPAQKAGLKVGDIIREVNGDSTEGRSNTDMVQIIRGFPGSTVDLTIERQGLPSNKVFSLDRAQVSLKNVPFSGMVNENIAYVVLTTFTANAGKNIEKAIKDLQVENEVKGVIIDLRNNGGGLLREAVNIVNLFVPAGKEVVSTKGKVKDRDRPFKTANPPLDLDLPVAVMINGSSASASEIVSGALQDYDRAVIIGQRSFGKGLVQNHREVGYNSRIKVTTSKYYIPSGRCIQSVAYENGEPKDIPDDKRAIFYTANGRPVLDGGGVTPDVKLEKTEEVEIIETLKKGYHIFDFATQYSLNKDSIEAPESFQFTDYNAFTSYLEKKEFTFVSKAEKELSEFETEAKEADLTVSTGIESLYAAVKAETADDLVEYKEAIIDVIEKEIISRYYFQSGTAKLNVANDKEIEETATLLEDTARYNELLKRTK